MDLKKNTPPTTAEVLIRCLENEGVQYIFGIPGEENLDVMNALTDSKIKFITVRHEQGAAFMADVYGRLTGKAGVCLSTLGPGATNLVTGVADANSDGAPLVAITGQVSTENMHITSHQYLDLTRMFEPITKRSKQIVRPDTTNEIVRLAFKYAENEKPGATHIDLPADAAALPVIEPAAQRPLRHTMPNREFSSSDRLEQAARLINSAKLPVILAGHSSVRNDAGRALTILAEQLKIPVINTMMAKGIIPWNSRYAMWTIGIPQKDFTDKVIEDADLVICVGYDIVEYAPSKWNPGGDKQIIHIDLRPAHVNKLYQPEAEVIGDISDSLIQLMRLCSAKSEPEFALQIKSEMEREFSAYMNDNSYPPKPQKVISDIRKVMAPDDILISDVGANKVWIARHYNCFKPNTCIISNGFATMGIAVPGAVSAKLIYPERKILAVTGDGGFMMNCQEMETAFRMKLPIVVLIFNDSSYGLIKWKQDLRFGKHCFVDFGNPDFVKFAESMHAKGYRVEKTEDFESILRDAFSQKIPAIIDCPIDYRENNRLSEHLKKIYSDI